MLFNAPELARGWLSVALASSTDDERPALHRTVSIEMFGNGVRLTATDSYFLLTSWVPAVEHEWDAEPGADEAPAITSVAIDLHGRGKGLLAHVLKLAGDDENAPLIFVRLSLGVTELDDDSQGSLDGMEATYVVIEHPDNERVELQAYEGEYPNWRKVLASFTPKKTAEVALNPEYLGRLAKLGKLHPVGGTLLWQFGAADKAARVEVRGTPVVSGLIMPVRWDFDRDEPRPEPVKKSKPEDDE